MTILLDQMVVWLPRLWSAVLLLCLFWLLVRLVSRLIAGVASRLALNPHLTMLFIRAARVGIWILGIITVFGTLGVDVTALVAGLGLTGFALGFALKDTISNMLAGVLILLYRPFEIGDQIDISGYAGQVLSIDLRYTVIGSDGKRVFVPNSKLFTEPLTVMVPPQK